jgi:hypothetical protein
MSTNFPTSLDTYTNPTPTDYLNSPSHSGQHANVNDAIEAIEIKLGINNSADVSSVDYLLNQILESCKSLSNAFAANVRDYGAVGDGTTDDTAAMQAAIDTGRKVVMPAGTYKITTALHPASYDQVFEGEGIGRTVIVPTGAICGFVDSPSLTYSRVVMRDFSITGANNTSHGIYFNKCCYDSLFENMSIYCGGKAIYFTWASNSFSYTLRNIHANSYNDNGIDIGGGTSVLLDNCYVHQIGANSVGYRIWAGAVMLSCNGIDSNSKYGAMFGANVGEDGVDVYPTITMIGCNIEDFNTVGIYFKNVISWGQILGGSIVARATGTFDCYIYFEGASGVHDTELHNVYCVTKGATMNKKAEIFVASGNSPVLVFGDFQTQYDKNGTLTNLPRLYTDGVNAKLV